MSLISTHLEDLSNEIFYEIFEYIEYSDLFKSFSDLNYRFETLLNHSYLSLKFNLNCTMLDYYTKNILPNKHLIGSLNLTNRPNILETNTLDSSFIHLKSIVFNQIYHQEFISFFPCLTSLPCLWSITIHFIDAIVALTEIYRLIFDLPYLKKIEISAKGHLLLMTLPINTSEHYSHIKYMFINHTCSTKELITLFSYTPLLRHLTCMELIRESELNLSKMLATMSHLTSITFHMCSIYFNEFEFFIKNFGKNLRALSINTKDDNAYLDAQRWEHVISQHMPNLRVFKFEYHEWHYQNIQLTTNHNQLDRFASSFWINRSWFFQIIADIDYWPPIHIIYSLQPDRRKTNENIKLKLTRLYTSINRQYLIDDFFLFTKQLQITHLEINCEKLLFSKFIKLLCLLSNLQFLEISSLSTFKLKKLSSEEIESVQLCSNTSNIKKLVFNSIMEEEDLDKMQYFINLLPRIEYLTMKCTSNVNIESILRYVLIQNIDKLPTLNLLCLCMPIVDDDIIKPVQTMIDQEKLLADYKLSRTTDRIYLQLK